MLDWQPIETAPKDARVLVYLPPDGRFGVCEAMTVRNVFDNDNHTTRKATHWMPLPEPPHA